MDAFYAAVELRERPELRDQPVAVGGRAEGRGVIATANYPARRYGIGSAMPTRKAMQLCPQLILYPPRFDLYRAVSAEVRLIFERYTSVIEPLSLDEAYLDVTDISRERNIPATQLAKQIKRAIFEETELTASTGVAANKMLAKIASDLRKPDGIAVIPPDRVAVFMTSLPLGKIPGIGPVTRNRLANLGFHLAGDVRPEHHAMIAEHFGLRFSSWLARRVQGLDERPVQTTRQRKSLGKESTFARNVVLWDDKLQTLDQLSRNVAKRLAAHNLKGRTLTLKIRLADFQTISRSTTADQLFFESAHMFATAKTLLARSGVVERPCRLLGLTVSNLDAAGVSSQPRSQWIQPELFPS
jgi:DNA polymerase-4